jgi:hypothetical protein
VCLAAKTQKEAHRLRSRVVPETTQPQFSNTYSLRFFPIGCGAEHCDAATPHA